MASQWIARPDKKVVVNVSQITSLQVVEAEGWSWIECKISGSSGREIFRLGRSTDPAAAKKELANILEYITTDRSFVYVTSECAE